MFRIAAALLVAVGCGGDKPQEVDRDALFDQLEADMVIKAYEDGRLGSPEAVKSDMEPHFQRLSVPVPIDSAGTFTPYDKMTDRQKMAFHGWHRSSQKVLDVIGPEILEAERKLLDELDKSEKNE